MSVSTWWYGDCGSDLVLHLGVFGLSKGTVLSGKNCSHSFCHHSELVAERSLGDDTDQGLLGGLRQFEW